MSKQFSIVMTDVDLQALEKVLRESGDVELLSGVPTEGDRGLQPLASLDIPLSQVGKVSLFCYLTPVGLPQRIILERPSSVKVTVDEQRSHLIDFWRSFYDGQNIKTGRLYYQNTYFEADRLVPKDHEFCRWADRVMVRVKRTLTYNKDYGAYVGTDAARGLASGTIKWKSAITDKTIMAVIEPPSSSKDGLTH